MKARLEEAVEKFLGEAFVVGKWKRLDPMIRTLQRQLGKAFRDQGREVLRLFGRMFGGRFFVQESIYSRALREADIIPPSELDWLQLFEQLPAGIRLTMEGALGSAIQMGFGAGASDIVKELGQAATGISFDLKHPRAQAFLEGRAAELVKGIDEVTRARLKQLVTEGASKGWGYGKLAQAIKDEFEEMGVGKPQKHIRSRAELISVTELGNSYEAGSEAAAQSLADAGLQMEKYWQTVGDSRVSAGCRTNQGAGWIPQNQNFPSGHSRPLRFPGCRCTALRRRAKNPAVAGPLPAPVPREEAPRQRRKPEPRTILGFSHNLEVFESIDDVMAKGEGGDGWSLNGQKFWRQYVKGTGVTGSLEKTIGLWGSPEPSFRARLKGSVAAIIDIAQRWATDHKQEAMALLIPDRNGTGGILSWNFERALTNQELGLMLHGIKAANQEYQLARAENATLPDVVAGLTVRFGKNRVEYWAEGNTDLDVAELLVEKAIQAAGLSSLGASWSPGYRRKILWKGVDYLIVEALGRPRRNLQMN